MSTGVVLKFKPIIPRGIDPKVFERELKAEKKKIAKEIKADFEKTTRTWESNVQFIEQTKLEGDKWDLKISTRNKIWHYVNEGTKKHMIVARRARALRFKEYSIPKSFAPGFLAGAGNLISGPGASFGNDVYTPYVNHPGTKARKFSITITNMWRKRYYDRMRAAMKRAHLKCLKKL